MDLCRILLALKKTIRQFSDSQTKITEDHVRRVASILQKILALELNKPQIHKLLQNIHIYFVFLNLYAKQPQNPCNTQFTVRMALQGFLLVVDQLQIHQLIVKKFLEIVYNSYLQNVNEKELFRVYLYLLSNVPAENVKALYRKYDSLQWIYDLVKMTDDIETQAVVTEVIIFLRQFGHSKLKFPEFEVLPYRTVIEKDQRCANIRAILNALNNGSTRFFSIECNSIEVNGLSAMKNIANLWLDIDLQQQKISFFCEHSLLANISSFQPYSITSFEIVSFSCKDITGDPKFFYSSKCEQLDVLLEVNVSCLGLAYSTENGASLEIRISLLKSTENFQMFLNYVLSKLFPASDINCLKQKMNMSIYSLVDMSLTMTGNSTYVEDAEKENVQRAANTFKLQTDFSNEGSSFVPKEPVNTTSVQPSPRRKRLQKNKNPIKILTKILEEPLTSVIQPQNKRNVQKSTLLGDEVICSRTGSPFSLTESLFEKSVVSSIAHLKSVEHECNEEVQELRDDPNTSISHKKILPVIEKPPGTGKKFERVYKISPNTSNTIHVSNDEASQSLSSTKVLLRILGDDDLATNGVEECHDNSVRDEQDEINVTSKSPTNSKSEQDVQPGPQEQEEKLYLNNGNVFSSKDAGTSIEINRYRLSDSSSETISIPISNSPLQQLQDLLTTSKSRDLSTEQDDQFGCRGKEMSNSDILWSTFLNNDKKREPDCTEEDKFSFTANRTQSDDDDVVNENLQSDVSSENIPLAILANRIKTATKSTPSKRKLYNPNDLSYLTNHTQLLESESNFKRKKQLIDEDQTQERELPGSRFVRSYLKMKKKYGVNKHNGSINHKTKQRTFVRFPLHYDLENTENMFRERSKRKSSANRRPTNSAAHPKKINIISNIVVKPTHSLSEVTCPNCNIRIPIINPISVNTATSSNRCRSKKRKPKLQFEFN